MRVDEPVGVEAVFDDQGRLTPRAFTFEGVIYRVQQIGRRWDEGEWEHTLVMTPEGQTWDLAYAAGLGAWRLMTRTPPSPGLKI